MDKKRFRKLLNGLTFGVAAFLSAVQAEQRFPGLMTHSKTELKLCSQAELKAFRLIHVGDAALYVEDCNSVTNIFSARPKLLRFLYDTSIPAKAFREASNEYLKINLGQKFDGWKNYFDQFNSNYRDIKPGDYYDLIYDPTAGLRLELNGKELAAIADREIALAYLNVWFGNEPFSEDLKKSLLKLTD